MEEEDPGQVKALLEQILKRLDDQSLVGDRRHEAQTAFHAHVSRQLQTICRLQGLMRADIDALRNRAAAPEPELMLARVARECGGGISASQEEILANSAFLGGDGDDDEVVVEEEEVFSTPPEATQQQEDDDPATMCTPAPSQDQSPAPPAKKPRVCSRGARINTLNASPEQKQPEQQQQTQPDPLLTIPTRTTTAATTSNSRQDHPAKDFIALARHKGIF